MKIERLFSILLILLNNERVTAEYLAQYFEVSKRTIYRDIESLTIAGVPIITYFGKNGGVGLSNRYKLDKYMFTDKEKGIILDCLEAREEILKDNNIQDLKEKIKGIITNNEKSFINNKIRYKSIQREEIQDLVNEKIKIINKAIDEKKSIAFTYTKYDGDTIKREVDPINIKFNYGSWYLDGFCYKRNAFRVFKLTRINDMSITANHIINSYENFPSDAKVEKSDQVLVKLRFKRSELGKIYDYFTKDEILEINKEYIIVSFTYYFDFNIINFILSFGNKVTVLEPPSIKMEVINTIKNIISNYDI